MLTWKQLQMENNNWAGMNFGEDRSARWPLLGLVEELGELAHARLKREQGIRGTPEEHLKAERDAVADSFIFFADVCNTQKWDMTKIAKSAAPEELQKTFGISAGRDAIMFMTHHLGLALSLIEERDLAKIAMTNEFDAFDAGAQDQMFLFLTGLSAYCQEQEWSLQELIEETWAVVSKRDWTKNKKDGLASEAVTPSEPKGQVKKKSG